MGEDRMMMVKRAAVCIWAVALSFIVSGAVAQTPNFGEALQKALFFYGAQRSGALPADNQVIWRGDSGLDDGGDVGHDLTGGWYDAGDHVKFGLPMASSAMTLAWGGYEYGDALQSAGLLDESLETIRWATDYMIKAHTGPSEFYYQVGDGSDDHSWWGPVEVIEEVMERPAFKVDNSAPGSTVTAATAAALAVASIIFRDSDPDYADECLAHARQLYEFADATRSDAGYTAANGFYTSFSGYWDELSAAATWLHLATGDAQYLDRAESAAENWGQESAGRGRNKGNTVWAYKWTHSWDDMHYMTAILLARITNDSRYSDAVERNLDYWQPGGGIHYTPGGLAWLDQWGALRYAANAAFLASVWSDTALGDPTKKPGYAAFAEDQISYILGDNPRNSSYVIGFGDNPPRNPHHRTGHGAWYNDINAPADNRHLLFGALVGGPGNDDGYTDDRTDYVQNEVATDYNAGLFGALARLYGLYGGSPLADFPEVDFLPPSARLPEYFVRARLLSEEATSTQVITQTSNRSAWPATVKDQLAYRYFFDLSETFAAGFDAGDITVTQGSSEAGTITGPFLWDGTIYYIEVDFSGTAIYPAGRVESERSTTFTLAAPTDAAWDPTNDWSRQGMVANFTYEPVDYSGMTSFIPLYDGATLLSGEEPSGSGEPPPPPPVDIDVFVADIALTPHLQGRRAYATAQVTASPAVAGVQVSITWSGFVAGNATATTDGAGVATFTSPKKKGSGVITLTVDGLAKSGYAYKPGSNVENSDSVSVP
jgi:hypothetical protein